MSFSSLLQSPWLLPLSLPDLKCKANQLLHLHKSKILIILYLSPFAGRPGSFLVSLPLTSICSAIPFAPVKSLFVFKPVHLPRGSECILFSLDILEYIFKISISHFTVKNKAIMATPLKMLSKSNHLFTNKLRCLSLGAVPMGPA